MVFSSFWLLYINKDEWCGEIKYFDNWVENETLLHGASIPCLRCPVGGKERICIVSSIFQKSLSL